MLTATTWLLSGNLYLKANDDVATLKWVAIEELDSKEFGLQSISKSIEMFKEMKKRKTI